MGQRRELGAHARNTGSVGTVGGRAKEPPPRPKGKATQSSLDGQDPPGRGGPHNLPTSQHLWESQLQAGARVGRRDARSQPGALEEARGLRRRPPGWEWACPRPELRPLTLPADAPHTPSPT
ncbi:hypothetical protein MDA_GLEAN10004783 [Myotis davidii]|uniref:Uncharacterized protein n=1 Tax=Myotis davidii TaxID=225400 RepID=L5LR81_MYODS|nr:hypothetical protein MDA_GLEAN10004783 [Myotis davidii]